MTETLMSLAPLLILIVLMYFLMIRPQKKKDKQIADMRNALSVGDEIITIGGICGKIATNVIAGESIASVFASTEKAVQTAIDKLAKAYAEE